MVYTITISRAAQKTLLRLPGDIAVRVRAAISDLATMPRPPGALKLHDLAYWRVRVSDYRIIYAIDDPAATITVIDIGHRRDVYR